METVRYSIGIGAGVLAMISYIPYITSILRHKTKPNRAAFLIWSVTSTITLAGYIGSGARTSIFIGIAYAIFETSVFLLSLKYGKGGLTKLDVSVLIIAALGVILWAYTDNPRLALYSGIVSEALGYIPIAVKSYQHPDSEDKTAWVIGTVAAALNLLALTSLKPEMLLYPLYILVCDAFIVAMILRRHDTLKVVTK